MRMKLFLLCLVLSSSTILSAQSFQGGVFGGINASQVDNDGYSGFNKLGLNAGAFACREIMTDLYWQIELRYSSRGIYNVRTTSNPSISMSNLIYLEMPLTVHYFYDNKIQAELGLAPDVLLAEFYGDETAGIDPSQADELKRFGLNSIAGIYYYFRENLGVGVRFTYSLVPFYRSEGVAVRYWDSGLFHNVFSLNLKYYIAGR